MLKRWTCFSIVLFSCVSIIAAQGRPTRKIKSTVRPNFSGVWEFDPEASVKNEIGTIVSAKIKNLVSLMTVKHSDPFIEFVETEEFEWANKPDSGRQVKETMSTYYTDGRGETNLLGIEYLTKTRWDGKKLVVTTYSWPPTAGKKEPVSRTLIELSADGDRLFKRFNIIAANKKEEKEFKRFEAVMEYKRRKE